MIVTMRAAIAAIANTRSVGAKLFTAVNATPV